MTAQTPISECSTSPQLMPFHIAYSGPAPISTFFRVREMEEDAQAIGWSSSTPESNGTENGVNEITPEKKEKKIGIKKHLVAAFRGRRVVGTEVPLPEGFTGLVLRSDGSKETASAPQNSSLPNGATAKNGRKVAARKTRRSKPIEVTTDDEYDTNIAMDPNEPDADFNGSMADGEVKNLRATETFKSLVIWNADVPVDEGRDEYIRALREWTTVAAEVNSGLPSSRMTSELIICIFRFIVWKTRTYFGVYGRLHLSMKRIILFPRWTQSKKTMSTTMTTA